MLNNNVIHAEHRFNNKEFENTQTVLTPIINELNEQIKKEEKELEELLKWIEEHKH